MFSEVKEFVRNLVTESMTNVQAQLDCFGISKFFIFNCFQIFKNLFFSEFLHDCKFYRGPHSVSCLNSIWKSVGCLDSGHGYPKNISSQAVASYGMFNLR